MNAMTPGRAFSRPYVFAAKYPEESLDYLIPAALVSDPTTEVVSNVDIACAPSGVGELVAADPFFDQNGISISLSGGQPGRIYTLKYRIALTSGLVRELLATLTVARVLVTDQPAKAPSDGFGPPSEWRADIPRMDFTDTENSGYVALIAGF